MDRWTTVKRLYQEAREQESSERAAFLDRACAGDSALREEVQSLLEHEPAAASFMEVPALEVAARELSRESPAPLVGRTLGHYSVRSLLGVGGMGDVYLAHDPRLDRAVALKILPPELALVGDRRQRFLREARAASALNHPNVATIHDVGESDGVRFIVMEYVEGETVAARITDRPLTATEIVHFGVQVADALDAAHAKGITHRDIKPSNLMVTPRGRVMVLDFGVAKTARHEDPGASSRQGAAGTETVVGSVIGSLPYMSPEQAIGQEIDHLSDLFGLGVTLYEMATGRLPFAGTTPDETIDRLLHSAPVPMTELQGAIAVELERIIFKCLEKDRAHRYQTARELLTDLHQLRYQSEEIARAPVEEARRHNLPALLTSFVGRRREIDEISSMLASTRLLTLTGAGGCGKTRLALQVAYECVGYFRDGVWAVDLAPLSDSGLIPHTVAAALGIREGPNRSLVDSLADYFRSRHVLMVLDNCEHMIAACAQLIEPLLHAAPTLHVLVTSREGLGISGETVWRVPSMSSPVSNGPIAPEALLQYESARLFADRAVTAQPSFSVSDENAAVVGEICRRLDGIPLAIELAAARLNVLSVDQIRLRLNDRFRLLTGGTRTAIARQGTLEATIDWSYDLLSQTERQLLHRLSVFPGGWTLEAAEDVCAGATIDSGSVLDLLSRLAAKSLVNVEDDAQGCRRYRCLETVRQYGRERLLRSEDAQRVRDAHLRFFLAFARRTEPELLRADQALWLTRMQIEHDNLRAALEWCLGAHGDEGAGLQMAAAMSWFWIKRGYLGEGRVWLERALAAPETSPGLTATALNALASITFFLGDYPASRTAAERGLALGRQACAGGEVAASLGIQALLAFESGDVERSAQLAQECRDAATASGEVWRQGMALECLAYQAIQQGDHQQACRLVEEALEMSRGMGDKWSMAILLSDLALFRVLLGRYDEAAQLCAEGLALSRQLADRLLTAFFLSILAGAQAGQGRHRSAARLWGAMHALLESVASPLQQSHKMWIGDRYISAAEGSLGKAAFDEALEEGRTMSWTLALQYAAAEISSTQGPQGTLLLRAASGAS